jgi:glycerol uptake facilitator-like aquaporin
MAAFDLPRRLAAEALGTAILVATVVGSGMMAERLSSGNMALALLGNTLPTGAILVVLITIFGGFSGAHFNPAVSLVFWVRREIAARDLMGYAGVQIVGGIIGTLAAHAMFGDVLFHFSAKIRSGPSQWFSEGVATFGLLLTILGTLRSRPEAVAWMVGLYITAAYWFTASTSFANPAVTIARALTGSFSGIAPASVPMFIVSQIVGAWLASLLAGWFFAPKPVNLKSESAPASALPAE